MTIPYIRTFLTLALAFATFSTQLTDRTTGQIMPGVNVSLDGPSRAHGKTNARGVVTIKNLKPGSYTVTVESKDVPTQTLHVTLHRGTTTDIPIKVCSMTLDYSCGMPGGGGGGG